MAEVFADTDYLAERRAAARAHDVRLTRISEELEARRIAVMAASRPGMAAPDRCDAAPRGSEEEQDAPVVGRKIVTTSTNTRSRFRQKHTVANPFRHSTGVRLYVRIGHVCPLRTEYASTPTTRSDARRCSTDARRHRR